MYARTSATRQQQQPHPGHTAHTNGSLPHIHRRSPVPLPYASGNAGRPARAHSQRSPDPTLPPALHFIKSSNAIASGAGAHDDALTTPPTNATTATTTLNTATTTYTTPSTRPITRLARPELQAAYNNTSATDAGGTYHSYSNNNNGHVTSTIGSEQRYVAMLPSSASPHAASTLATTSTTPNTTQNIRRNKNKAVYRFGRSPGLLICQTASAEDLAFAPRLQLFCCRHVKLVTSYEVDQYDMSAVRPQPANAMMNTATTTTTYTDANAAANTKATTPSPVLRSSPPRASQDAAVQTDRVDEDEQGSIVSDALRAAPPMRRPASNHGPVYTTVVPSPHPLPHKAHAVASQLHPEKDEKAAEWMSTPLSEAPAHMFTPVPPITPPSAPAVELTRHDTRAAKRLARGPQRPSSGPATTTSRRGTRNTQAEEETAAVRPRVESEPPHAQAHYRRSTVPQAQPTRREDAVPLQPSAPRETEEKTKDAVQREDEQEEEEEASRPAEPASPLPRDPELTSNNNNNTKMMMMPIAAQATIPHAEPVSPQSGPDVDGLMKQHSFEIMTPQTNVLALSSRSHHNNNKNKNKKGKGDEDSSLSTIVTTLTSAETRLVTQASVYLGNALAHPLSRTETMTCIEEQASVEATELSSNAPPSHDASSQEEMSEVPQAEVAEVVFTPPAAQDEQQLQVEEEEQQVLVVQEEDNNTIANTYVASADDDDDDENGVEDDDEVDERYATPLQQAVQDARAALRSYRQQPSLLARQKLCREPTALNELRQLMHSLRPPQVHPEDDMPPSTLSERGFVQLCAALWLGRFPALYTVEELVLQWRQLRDKAARVAQRRQRNKGEGNEAEESTTQDTEEEEEEEEEEVGDGSEGVGNERRAEFADELHELWAQCVHDYIANVQPTTAAPADEEEEGEEASTSSSSYAEEEEEEEGDADVMETLTPFTDPAETNTNNALAVHAMKRETTLEFVPATSSTLPPSSAEALAPPQTQPSPPAQEEEEEKDDNNKEVYEEQMQHRHASTSDEEEHEGDEEGGNNNNNNTTAMWLEELHDDESLRCCPATLWQRPLCPRSLSEQLVHLVLTLLVTNHDQYTRAAAGHRAEDGEGAQEKEKVQEDNKLPTALTRLLSQEQQQTQQQVQRHDAESTSLAARMSWRLFLGVPQWSNGYWAAALGTLRGLDDVYIRQWCAVLLRDFVDRARQASMRGGLGSFAHAILRSELPQAAFDDCGCMLEKLRWVVCAANTDISCDVADHDEEYEVMLPSSDFVQAWHRVRDVWPQHTALSSALSSASRSSSPSPAASEEEGRESSDDGEGRVMGPSLLTLARRLRHFFAGKSPARLRGLYAALLYDVWRYAQLITAAETHEEKYDESGGGDERLAGHEAVLCRAFVREGAAWLQAAAVMRAHVSDMANADSSHTMGELLTLEMSEAFTTQCFTTAQTCFALDDPVLPCGSYNSELFEAARLQYAAETLEQTRRLQACICRASTTATSESKVNVMKGKNTEEERQGRATVRDVLHALCALEPHVPVSDVQEYIRHLLVLYYSQHTLDGLPVVPDEAERVHARVVAEELSLQDWFAPTNTLLQDYASNALAPSSPSLCEVAWVNVYELAALCPRVLYRPHTYTRA